MQFYITQEFQFLFQIIFITFLCLSFSVYEEKSGIKSKKSITFKIDLPNSNNEDKESLIKCHNLKKVKEEEEIEEEDEEGDREEEEDNDEEEEVLKNRKVVREEGKKGREKKLKTLFKNYHHRANSL